MKHFFALLTLTLAASLPAAHASTMKLVDITNDYQDTGLWFWADGAPNPSFAQYITMTRSLADWSATVNDGTRLFLSGPAVAPGAGKLRLRLSYDSAPFSFQWAELYFDGVQNQLRGAGTLSWERVGTKLQWMSSSTFTHLAEINPGLGVMKPAAVPLPGTEILFLSGLALAPLVRRRAET